MVIRTSLRPLGKNEDDGIPKVEFGIWSDTADNYTVMGINTYFSESIKNKVCITPMVNFGTSFTNPDYAYIGNWFGGACYSNVTKKTNSGSNRDGNIGNLTFEHGGTSRFVAWPQLMDNTGSCFIVPPFSNNGSTTNLLLDPTEGNAYLCSIGTDTTKGNIMSFCKANLDDFQPTTTNRTHISSYVNQTMITPLMYIGENGTVATKGNVNSSLLGGIINKVSSGAAQEYKLQKLPNGNNTGMTVNYVSTSINYDSWKLPIAYYYCSFANGWANKVAVCCPLTDDYSTAFKSLTCLAPDTSQMVSNKPANIGGFTATSYDYDSSSIKRYIRIVGGARGLYQNFFYDTFSTGYESTVFGVYKEADSKYKLLYLSARPTSSGGAIWKSFRFPEWTHRLTFKKDVWCAKLCSNILVVQFMDSSIAFINGQNYTVIYFRPVSSITDTMTDNDDIRYTSKRFLILSGVSNGYIDFVVCTGNPTVANGWFPKCIIHSDDTIKRTSATWDYIKANAEVKSDLIMYDD